MLVIDESGAKAHATKQENFPGEEGVVAGFLIDQQLEQGSQILFRRVYQQYLLETGSKLHITDLRPEK